MDTNRRSAQLGLDFPYDWSNPRMSDDAFIRAVLQKERFMDVLRVCAHYGTERVAEIAGELEGERPRLARCLANIREGQRRAQARRHPA